MPTNASVCYRILTPKQVGPICWFMAAFVAMFYSQRSRKILLEESKGWIVKKNEKSLKSRLSIFGDKKKTLFKLLKHILDDRYLKVGLGSRESMDYNKFSDNTFGKVLSLLNKVDNKSFPYIPSKVSGFNAEYYIGKLYKLLNVDYEMYDYNVSDNFMTYSFLNEEFSNKVLYRINKKLIETRVIPNKTFKYLEKNIKIAPPILIIIVRNNKENTDFYKDTFPNNTLKEGVTKDELKSMRERIYYMGTEYNLDSVILSNWNINKNNGHSIAGITCKKGKYIYNGWTRTSMDPVMANKIITRNIPCELMEYDWNIKYNDDFCLNTAKCIPDALKHKLSNRDICFNFSKGTRILVYVRKNAKQDTSTESNRNTVTAPYKKESPKEVPKKPKPRKPLKPLKPSPKKCPEGKVLNPKTGRCILIKNIAKVKKINKVRPLKPLKPLKPSPKKCPEGKVLNPKTGRCILIKNVAKAKN